MSNLIWRQSTKEKCCGNCRYYAISDWDDGLICTKPGSDNELFYTPFDYCCEEYDSELNAKQN